MQLLFDTCSALALHGHKLIQLTCLQGTDESGKLQQRLTRAVATALKKVQGRAAQLAKQLDGARGSGDTAKQADLIMAHLHQCALTLSAVFGR